MWYLCTKISTAFSEKVRLSVAARMQVSGEAQKVDVFKIGSWIVPERLW
jgi:hypothetical protein